MTIAHTGISVPQDKYAATVKFYETALGPLGYKKLMSFLDGNVLGFGDKEHSCDWWLTSVSTPTSTSHHAFEAKGSLLFRRSNEKLWKKIFSPGLELTQLIDRATVDAFHAAGIASGGKDNGAPGLRAHYHPNYYAAYVHDPAGNNIEVVVHTPPSE